jgi:hypothetical protein
MEKCDFCFQPEVNDFRWYHFDAIDDIRLAGKECAAKGIDDLLKKINDSKNTNSDTRGFWARLFK